MNSSLSAWKVKGFIFSGILGVLLHFLYDWTGENGVVALFSAVNESTWEHMKILFFPMFIFAFIEGRYNKYDNFWWSKLSGIMLGTLMIPVLFYTINGLFGRTPDLVNILIFFVALFIALYTETRIIKSGKTGFLSERQSILILCAVALLFMVFTYYPPEIPLFIDPLSGEYGI